MAEEVEIVRDNNNTFLEKKANLRALQLDLCNKPGDPAKQKQVDDATEDYLDYAKKIIISGKTLPTWKSETVTEIVMWQVIYQSLSLRATTKNACFEILKYQPDITSLGSSQSVWKDLNTAVINYIKSSKTDLDQFYNFTNTVEDLAKEAIDFPGTIRLNIQYGSEAVAEKLPRFTDRINAVKGAAEQVKINPDSTQQLVTIATKIIGSQPSLSTVNDMLNKVGPLDALQAQLLTNLATLYDPEMKKRGAVYEQQMFLNNLELKKGLLDQKAEAAQNFVDALEGRLRDLQSQETTEKADYAKWAENLQSDIDYAKKDIEDRKEKLRNDIIQKGEQRVKDAEAQRAEFVDRLNNTPEKTYYSTVVKKGTWPFQVTEKTVYRDDGVKKEQAEKLVEVADVAVAAEKQAIEENLKFADVYIENLQKTVDDLAQQLKGFGDSQLSNIEALQKAQEAVAAQITEILNNAAEFIVQSKSLDGPIQQAQAQVTAMQQDVDALHTQLQAQETTLRQSLDKAKKDYEEAKAGLDKLFATFGETTTSQSMGRNLLRVLSLLVQMSSSLQSYSVSYQNFIVKSLAACTQLELAVALIAQGSSKLPHSLSAAGTYNALVDIDGSLAAFKDTLADLDLVTLKDLTKKELKELGIPTDADADKLLAAIAKIGFDNIPRAQEALPQIQQGITIVQEETAPLRQFSRIAKDDYNKSLVGYNAAKSVIGV